jgi:hypothetical protein
VLAYYLCYGPAGTTIDQLVRVAGARWATYGLKGAGDQAMIGERGPPGPLRVR